MIRKSFQARSCVALLSGVNGLAAEWIPTEGNKRMVNLGRFFFSTDDTAYADAAACRAKGSSSEGIARGCQRLGWLLIGTGQTVLAVSRSKKIFTLVHPWLQHPSTQQGCAKAAFHKVDDIAVGSTDRADTQADRQAGREHTCTDESLDIIACEASRYDS